MSKPIKISPYDLLMLMGHAKTRLLAQPHESRLPNMLSPLTDGERMALAYLDAALTLLGSKGIDTSHVVIELVNQDSDPIEG